MSITNNTSIKRRHDEASEPRRERHVLVSRATKHDRSQLFESVSLAAGDRISPEELDIHFTHMPARYWSRANESTVARHLDIIHAFITGLQSEHSDGTTPVVRWHNLPGRSLTEVEICTWDRLGLLAKVAGAFASVGLNIVRADIYTRADNIVLDVFHICDEAQQPVHDEVRLKKMAQLLEASLKPNAADAPALQLPATRETTAAPSVTFDLDHVEGYTPVLVEADDRVGLLHDIFTGLAECEVNIVHAIITTEGGRTGDVFFLSDADDRKLEDPARLEQIRQRLLARLQ